MFGLMCLLLIVIGCLELVVMHKRAANKPASTPYTDNGLDILGPEDGK